MLVRVADALEAAAAAAAGVDAIETIVAAPIDHDALHAIRLAFPGPWRVRGAEPLTSREIVAAAATCGADEVGLARDAFPFEPDGAPAAGPAIVAILGGADLVEAVQRVRDSVGFVMLEAGGHRLMDAADIAALDAFAFACRAAGLSFGLAGGLEAPDVARLLLLEPDMLGFDTAVRRNHRVGEPLDAAALVAIRALVPREGDETVAREPSESVVDCVFVRDFAVSLSIGAYKAEHGMRQRVRFSVDAEVVRKPLPPHDMREIFSYDVIIETIRVLSQRPHVTFVETLAEEVAAALLTHGDLIAVKVKVEKLDVVDGSVGIEIVRRRRQTAQP